MNETPKMPKQIWKPLGNRVLAQFAPWDERKTDGGIIVGSNSPPNVLGATVEAVGPGAPNAQGVFVEPRVKVGDHVLVHWQAGTPVDERHPNTRIVGVEELLAVEVTP